MNTRHGLIALVLAALMFASIPTATAYTCVPSTTLGFVCVDLHGTGYSGTKNASLTIWVTVTYSGSANHDALVPAVGDLLLLSGYDVCTIPNVGGCGTSTSATLTAVPVGTCANLVGRTISVVTAAESQLICAY